MVDDKRLGGYDASKPGIEQFPGIPKTGTIMCLALNEDSYADRRKQLKELARTTEDQSSLIQIRREDEAYEIGKPAKQVELDRLDGSKTKEEVHFKCIEDFEPESYTQRIPHLRKTNDEKLALEDMLHLIQNEEGFREALSDSGKRRQLAQIFGKLAKGLESLDKETVGGL